MLIFFVTKLGAHKYCSRDIDNGHKIPSWVHHIHRWRNSVHDSFNVAIHSAVEWVAKRHTLTFEEISVLHFVLRIRQHALVLCVVGKSLYAGADDTPGRRCSCVFYWHWCCFSGDFIVQTEDTAKDTKDTAETYALTVHLLNICFNLHYYSTPIVYKVFIELFMLYYFLITFENLHNGMILSSFTISSHGFAMCFPGDFIRIEIIFLDHKPWSFSDDAHVRTFLFLQ